MDHLDDRCPRESVSKCGWLQEREGFLLRQLGRLGRGGGATLSIKIPPAHVLAIEDSEHMIAVWMVTESGER